MRSETNKGLWPVMLTPFTDAGEIDYASLERLIDWYEKGGANGLFAACQSSEIFYLSLRERVEMVRFIKQHAHIPVIASGHVSDSMTEQIDELQQISKAGPDAVILITNRLVHAGNQQESIMPAVRKIMDSLDPDMPLGFYECPQPFKRLITLDELQRCAETGRFAFMKDTCCDAALIAKRVEAIKGTPLQLFNANSTTYLDSLRAGAAGFSGVMLGFHIDLYAWLFKNWQSRPEEAETLQSFLTMFSEIERQYYPVNAKYHQRVIEHVFESDFARTKPMEGLTDTFKEEVHHMQRCAEYLRNTLCRE